MKCLSMVIILLFPVLLHPSVANNLLLNRLINSLENSLLYFEKNDYLVDENLLLGIAITKGQLSVAEKYDEHRYYKNIFSQLKTICGTIFQQALRNNVANLQHDETRFILLSWVLWSFDITEQQLNKKELLPFTEKYDGILNETLSGKCMEYLFRNCLQPKICLNAVLNDELGGYSLTHQILYLQVARQMGCIIKFTSGLQFDIVQLLHGKCNHLFSDLLKIHRQIFINDNMQDLFIEGIVVCGLENYSDFFKEEWMKFIINSQTEFGNFVYYGGHRKSKKENIHLSSVSIAAVTLYIKHILQNQELLRMNTMH